MTDNMKQFLEVASKDKDLIEKLNQAPDMESVIALAKEKGFILTEEDLKQDARIQNIPDENLDAVAGGDRCICALGGGGTGTEANEKTCACVMFGLGEKIKGDEIEDRCVCGGWGTGY